MVEWALPALVHLAGSLCFHRPHPRCAALSAATLLTRASPHARNHQRRREGQEDQLGALGLVVNIIVLWNTIYMDAALEQLQKEGYPIQPEDVARLSPLGFEHVNLLGRYAFSLPESVIRGQLRPLRNPAEVLEEVV
jgi:hypothetical protein